MKQVKKAKRPTNVPKGTEIVDIERDDKKLVRVAVERVESSDGSTFLKTQSVRIDKTGAIVLGANGLPVMGRQRIHTVKPGMMNRLRPGWLRVEIAKGDIPYRADPRNLVVDEVPTAPPAEADRDVWALVGVDYYRWDDGEITHAAMKDATLLAE